MTFAPKRKQSIPAQATTTIATPQSNGLSMQEFYRGIFGDPRAALKAPGQAALSENEMVRFYRELNTKPTHSDNAGSQGNNAFMAANEANQDASPKTTNSTLIYPTAGPYITSPYGNRRHPVTGEEHFHSATDYRNAKENPVFSSRDGTIVAKGKDSKGTNFIKIRDKDGIVFGYFHTDSRRNVGDAVNMGDEIGFSDDSGRATKAHLHFTIEPKGTRDSRVDPDKFLNDNNAGKKEGKE